MTPKQIENKIADLEQWLRDNPNHANRNLIESDLRKLRTDQIGQSRNKLYKDER